MKFPGGHFCLLLFLVLAGCVSPAAKLDGSLVVQIKEGTTTHAGVESLLGKTTMVITNSAGRQVWIYHHRTGITRRNPQSAIMFDPTRPSTSTVYTSASGQLRVRMLSILFGLDGRVDRKHLYESSSDYGATLTGAHLGTRFGHEQLATIQKGVTDRPSLVNVFGEPFAEFLNPEGNLVLGWNFSELSPMPGAQPKRQRLEVLLGRSGIVIDYEVSRDSGRRDQ